MSNAQQLLGELTRKLAEADEATRPIPTPTPPVGHRRLCVGMATFDDFDGVWFTVQAIRLYHPEVADDLSFVVLDNHPEGESAADLKGLDRRVPGLRYLPFRGYRSTAARDLIFREADAEVVVCVDSHVLVAPGALRAILDWYDAHPDSRDLIQGPLLSDDLSHVVGTHFADTWGGGMYGQWATDPRVDQPGIEPFDIPMQGLGLFACRRDAWPGLNPRLRGFGGEEGYLHEKVRQGGGRVLCHPQVRWAHRFTRPGGPPYRPTWEDRIRNYRLGWGEVGWDTAPMEDHFRQHLGELHEADPQGILDQTARQVANPFTFFDAIFALNLDDDTERWQAAQHRYAVLDIAWRVERFPAVPTPQNHHRGCTQSWRAMIAEADRRGYEHMLVLEDDAVFLDDTLEVLAGATAELADQEWDLCFLGACVHAQEFPLIEGGHHLQRCGLVTCTHALAVHRRAFARILSDIPGPDDVAGEVAMDRWLEEWTAVDQYFGRGLADGTFRGVITTPRVATQPALATFADADLALADRYVI